MFTTVHTAAVLGLDCTPITVEVDISNGWPGFCIVGLPDAAVQEARERIRTAWKNTDLRFPNNKRVVINLAPADVRKEGTAYDLPMAVAMFVVSEELSVDFSSSLFVGEMSLDGKLRHTAGILPIAIYAKAQGFSSIFVPAANAEEASVINGISIFPVASFQDIVSHIEGSKEIQPLAERQFGSLLETAKHSLDMADIKGHSFVKRALEIAASGSHNILLNGPPGSGKTLLARTYPSILPKLTIDEAIEVTKIYSISGLLKEGEALITDRPFRSPHHSASSVALVGGGTFPRPGEISLAHRGVLFLDEFPEFPRPVLETLRQPLEDGVVTISRAQGTLSFPAQFSLIASQNPCPCGFSSDPQKNCSCSQMEIARYQKKISGPLLDRIDLHVEVPRLEFEKLTAVEKAESSVSIQMRVESARKRQRERFKESPCATNSEMTNREIRLFCTIDAASTELMRQAVTTLQLSARSYHRILKVARTIADLSESEDIHMEHVAEALQYRTRTA